MATAVPAGEVPAALTAAFWKAVAMLRFDRQAALDGLEAAFRTGATPAGLEGSYAGRLLTTTVGWGLDPVFGTLAAVWMPWRGKVFDPAAGEGRNRFTPGGGRAISWPFPDYGDIQLGGPGEVTAFRFVTGVGPSATAPDRSVLRIDYDLPDNPDSLIRRVLDELVRVGPDAYLGQALVRRGLAYQRAAWFLLEDDVPRGTEAVTG
ncbi:MAG: hypothetical protein M3N52_06720 [Actinomycetota bacterium]|nr:hypothetical protein [Actinomycetota bacterium]